MFFQNFLFLDILVYTLYIGLYGILIAFFVIQLFKVEKIAQPFLISLIIYFLCVGIGAIIMYLDNRRTLWGTLVPMDNTNIFSTFNFFGLALLVIASMFLIYNLEKNAFKNSLLKEKHLVTITQFLLIVYVFIQAFISASNYLVGIYLLILLIQVCFFTGGFLYIGIKSNGIIRFYCILVSVSYFSIMLSNGANFLLASILRAGYFPSSLDDFMLYIGILFLIRSIFTILLSFGLIKLYLKRT